MKRTETAFSLAFSTAMSMAASEASKEGKPESTIKKLVVLSLKAGAAFNAGTGLTPEIEQLAQDAELVKLAKEEDQTVADAIELMEKQVSPSADVSIVSKAVDREPGFTIDMALGAIAQLNHAQVIEVWQTCVANAGQFPELYEAWNKRYNALAA